MKQHQLKDGMYVHSTTSQQRYELLNAANNNTKPTTMRPLPKEIQELVGKEMQFDGAIFSYTDALPEFTASVLDVRRSMASITNLETWESWNAFEMKIKHPNRKRAQWTRPMKIESEPRKETH